MTGQILQSIGQRINDANPNAFSCFFTGAKRLVDGRIVIESVRKDFQYVGPNDRNGNYFYIRYSDDAVNYSEVPESQRTTSCSNTRGSVQARFVAWIIEGDQERMHHAFINDLLTCTGSIGPFQNVVTTPDRVLLNWDQIYQDETEETDVRRKKGVTVIAIEFTTGFTYRKQDPICIERELCVPCG